MKISELFKLLNQRGRLNYFVVCPDTLGLLTFIQSQALNHISSKEDQHFYAARDITKEKARQIESDARMAPRGGSELQHFFIHGLQRLPTDSVGPLLKAVEDAKYSRFIFQAQSIPRKIQTLMSRSSVAYLPFMSKAAVLANLKALKKDAKTADEMNLWDGTYDGTSDSLGMKDTLTRIRRDASQGTRGLAALFDEGTLGSRAFEKATYELLNEQEKRFIQGPGSIDRKRIALYLASRRQS